MRCSELRISMFRSCLSRISRASRFDRLTVLSHVEGHATLPGHWRHFSTSGKGRSRLATQNISGKNRRVTPGRLVKRSAYLKGASSWSRSAGRSSERAQKTIRSRVQNVRLHELKPASGLRRHGDEGRKSHAFPERHRKAPSRPPARLFLLVGTTNRQSSSLIP